MPFDISNAKILVIDDDVSLARVIYFELRQRGYSVDTANSGQKGLEQFEKEHFDVVLTDLRMEELSGMDVLKQIMADAPETTVIMMTAYGTMDDAMKAVKLGAADYLTKPFATDQLAFVIEKSLRMRQLEEANVNLRQQVLERSRFDNLIGESQPMQEVYRTAEKVAVSDAPILLLGETGTGKEELAKAIHNNSRRAESNFVPVNCGSIPENLIESELFGHEKGAFTGAERRHIGSFEQANMGTIFLDEIAELPLHVQVKLLRVLQEHEIRRVGGEETITLNIRVVAATNQDLQSLVDEGAFREDLYYRLNVVSITLPPLRDRGEDIELLAEYFLQEFAGGRSFRMGDAVYQRLRSYEFPGNVRELRNAMQRAVVIAEDSEITINDLPPRIRDTNHSRFGTSIDFSDFTLEEIERNAILQALNRNEGNQSQAARDLAIPRHVLIYRMQKFGLYNKSE